MERTDQPKTRKSIFMIIVRNLLLYALVPFLIFWLLSGPIGNAARRSDAAAFGMLAAAFGAAGLNWAAYSAVRGKRPSLLVWAHGLLCVLVTVVIAMESLPSDHRLRPTLAVTAGWVGLASAFLFSLWCARKRNKAAHAAAVVIWILLGLFFCGMLYQVFRDFETGCVTLDTWISIGSMVLFAVVFCSPKIAAAVRNKNALRLLSGQAEGKILQILGITHLDRDDDLVTLNAARIQYTVDGVARETRAGISRFTTRLFGREAFIGLTVPVRYDPSDPGRTYVKRLDKHIFEENGIELPGRWEILRRIWQDLRDDMRQKKKEKADRGDSGGAS